MLAIFSSNSNIWTQNKQHTLYRMPGAQMKKLGMVLAAAGLGGLAVYTSPWKNELPKDKDRSRTNNVKFPESKMPPIRQDMLEKPQGPKEECNKN